MKEVMTVCNDKLWGVEVDEKCPEKWVLFPSLSHFPRPARLTIGPGIMVYEPLLGFNSFWLRFSFQSDSNHRCWTLILWCLQEMSFQEGPDWMYHPLSLFAIVFRERFLWGNFPSAPLTPFTPQDASFITARFLSSFSCYCHLSLFSDPCSWMLWTQDVSASREQGIN